MAYCRICDVGHKVVFVRRFGFPPECPECGRSLLNQDTLDTDTDALRIEELIRERTSAPAQETPEQTPSGPASGPAQPVSQVVVDTGSRAAGYVLVLPGGKEIPIPAGGCIVGRTETGGEELAEYGSVSRQHVRITPKRNGVEIEDLSTYGTWVNGIKLEKNVPERFFEDAEGAKIVLCNLEATLVVR